MDQIGIFDAKTRFSEIVKQVNETGLGVLVTNRGQPMVEIVPAGQSADHRRTPREAFEELDQLRRTLPKSSIEQIQTDINEGRR